MHHTPNDAVSWIDLAAHDELPLGEGRVFEVGDREVALFRVGDCVHALNNFCPHQGAALAEGTVSDGQVACPWHGWRFDLQGGDCTTIPGEQAITYPVRVTGGRVEVQLPVANNSPRIHRTVSDTVQ